MTFSLDPFRELAHAPGLWRSAMLSLVTGVATTAVAFAIAFLFVAGWRGTRVFAGIERLVSPLLSVPHAAAAFGLALLVGPSGFLFRLLPIWERPPDLLIVQDRLGVAMTIGLIAKEIPFIFLMMLASLPQTRAAETERMMASLGYGRVLGFVVGVGPPLYRQVRLAIFAVLAFSTSVVDVALILGPTTPAPLAVRILEWQNSADLGGRFLAAAGAALQIATTALALLLWLVLERLGGAVRARLATFGLRGKSDRWLRLTAAILMGSFAGIVCLGISLLALWSVASDWRFPRIVPGGLTLATWRQAIGGLATPLLDTLMLAAASSFSAIVLALGSLESAARRGRSGAGPALRALYVPLVAPQIAFLSGLTILFSSVGLDGRFAAVAIVHLVFVFPYVLLSLSEPWNAWDPRYGFAVRALGRGPGAVFWRVRLPMIALPVLTAAALGFAISVALYLPTLLIGAGRWPTVTTEAVALASGGDPRLIGVTGLLQAALPFLGFTIAAAGSAILHRRRRAMRVAA